MSYPTQRVFTPADVPNYRTWRPPAGPAPPSGALISSHAHARSLTPQGDWNVTAHQDGGKVVNMNQQFERTHRNAAPSPVPYRGYPPGRAPPSPMPSTIANATPRPTPASPAILDYTADEALDHEMSTLALELDLIDQQVRTADRDSGDDHVWQPTRPATAAMAEVSKAVLHGHTPTHRQYTRQNSPPRPTASHLVAPDGTPGKPLHQIGGEDDIDGPRIIADARNERLGAEIKRLQLELSTSKQEMRSLLRILGAKTTVDDISLGNASLSESAGVAANTTVDDIVGPSGPDQTTSLSSSTLSQSQSSAISQLKSENALLVTWMQRLKDQLVATKQGRDAADRNSRRLIRRCIAGVIRRTTSGPFNHWRSYVLYSFPQRQLERARVATAGRSIKIRHVRGMEMFRANRVFSQSQKKVFGFVQGFARRRRSHNAFLHWQSLAVEASNANMSLTRASVWRCRRAAHNCIRSWHEGIKMNHMSIQAWSSVTNSRNQRSVARAVWVWRGWATSNLSELALLRTARVRVLRTRVLAAIDWWNECTQRSQVHNHFLHTALRRKQRQTLRGWYNYVITRSRSRHFMAQTHYRSVARRALNRWNYEAMYSQHMRHTEARVGARCEARALEAAIVVWTAMVVRNRTARFLARRRWTLRLTQTVSQWKAHYRRSLQAFYEMSILQRRNSILRKCRAFRLWHEQYYFRKTAEYKLSLCVTKICRLKATAGLRHWHGVVAIKRMIQDILRTDAELRAESIGPIAPEEVASPKDKNPGTPSLENILVVSDESGSKASSGGVKADVGDVQDGGSWGFEEGCFDNNDEDDFGWDMSAPALGTKTKESPKTEKNLTVSTHHVTASSSQTSPLASAGSPQSPVDKRYFTAARIHKRGSLSKAFNEWNFSRKEKEVQSRLYHRAVRRLDTRRLMMYYSAWSDILSQRSLKNGLGTKKSVEINPNSECLSDKNSPIRRPSLEAVFEVTPTGSDFEDDFEDDFDEESSGGGGNDGPAASNAGAVAAGGGDDDDESGWVGPSVPLSSSKSASDATQRSHISALEAKVEIFEAQINDGVAALEGARMEREGLVDEIAALQNQLDNFQRTNSLLRDENASLASRADALQNDLDDARQKTLPATEPGEGASNDHAIRRLQWQREKMKARLIEKTVTHRRQVSVVRAFYLWLSRSKPSSKVTSPALNIPEGLDSTEEALYMRRLAADQAEANQVLQGQLRDLGSRVQELLVAREEWESERPRLATAVDKAREHVLRTTRRRTYRQVMDKLRHNRATTKAMRQATRRVSASTSRRLLMEAWTAWRDGPVQGTQAYSVTLPGGIGDLAPMIQNRQVKSVISFKGEDAHRDGEVVVNITLEKSPPSKHYSAARVRPDIASPEQPPRSPSPPASYSPQFSPSMLHQMMESHPRTPPVIPRLRLSPVARQAAAERQPGNSGIASNSGGSRGRSATPSSRSPAQASVAQRPASATPLGRRAPSPTETRHQEIKEAQAKMSKRELQSNIIREAFKRSKGPSTPSQPAQAPRGRAEARTPGTAPASSTPSSASRMKSVERRREREAMHSAIKASVSATPSQPAGQTGRSVAHRSDTGAGIARNGIVPTSSSGVAAARPGMQSSPGGSTISNAAAFARTAKNAALLTPATTEGAISRSGVAQGEPSK